jgi:uncharacterized protein
MRRGVATFTLDNGHCPPWLFERMVKLGREMVDILVAELGPDEFIARISDPVWFQSLGTVLAFDWNASGLTTILTAALKEAIRGRERELGIFICGGKGKTSLKTPEQIEQWGMRLGLPGGVVSNLTYNSKMAAKVDSSLVQDGYQLYHHAFFFSLRQKRTRTNADFTQINAEDDSDSPIGSWAVVQQGMNQENKTARRYHWYSPGTQVIADSTPRQSSGQTQTDHPSLSSSFGRAGADEDTGMNFVREPHKGISSQEIIPHMLNMTARESQKAQSLSVDLIEGGYVGLMKDIEILRRHSSQLSRMATVRFKTPENQTRLFTALELENTEFHHHPVEFEDFSKSKYLEKILSQVTYAKPDSYEKFVAMPGVGAKTVRALALVSEVIYGATPSYEDPARYSFAFGGKDATPYPVDRPTYDRAIEILKNAVLKTKLSAGEKHKITGRLERS